MSRKIIINLIDEQCYRDIDIMLIGLQGSLKIKNVTESV